MEASAHRARARAALTGNWGTAIAVSLLASIISGADGSPTININLNNNQPLEVTVPEEMLRILGDFLGMTMPFILTISLSLLAARLILGGVMELGKSRFYLNLVDGIEAEVGDLFTGFSKFLKALVMNLTSSILFFLGTLVFIIPGLLLSYGFAMAPYILSEDPDCTGWEALERSYRMMRGHRLELFELELTFIGWDLLALLTFGIGTLLLNPYKSAAKASFYRELLQESRCNPEF